MVIWIKKHYTSLPSTQHYRNVKNLPKVKMAFPTRKWRSTNVLIS